MPDETRELDRRRFLGVCAGALAASALGCASVAIRPVDLIDGRLSLPLIQYPELTTAGGSLVVAPRGQSEPVYVMALGGGRFVALSPICTHLGCTVDVQGERLVCPCHGSTYDREGRVLRGPAERPLATYRVNVTADEVLVIDLQR